ncbi:MAG: [Fe-Fe] hydrogenase large subunit C-terminal domain-containing protein [Terracidiphilus sp.]|nr:[Fe-Fe] hydrogenase large subunit C-terminal domain-containing protein [Terracidiphilus sp.]
MELLDPIYTRKRECQDCHKCIRECPVKSIRVEDSCSQVMPGFCILCGNCVLACPSSAVQVRRDLPRAQELLSAGRRVIASLDPSFAAQFPGVRPGQIVRALKQLGFFAVSETALGAEMVASSVARLMREQPPRVWISSACPSVVDFITMYHPECQPQVAGVLSPLLAHCRMLRAHYGDDIAIVFIGPCIAKKKDADLHPELLDAVLTFEDLDHWLGARGLRPHQLDQIVDSPDDHFEPAEALEGALHAVEGGMAQSLARGRHISNLQCMAFSGIANVEHALKDVPGWKPDHPIFLEMSACAGACINGPGMTAKTSIARRHYDVTRYAKPASTVPLESALDISCHYTAAPIVPAKYGELPLREALRWVGQHSPEDALNCGGCGYQSCRDFAHALLAGNAERMMCATYTRKLAQKKANALLRRMPSAVVIVDEDLKIIDCNPNFSQLFPADPEPNDIPGSAAPSGVLPFAGLFRRVLDSGEDILSHDIRYKRKILNTSIFTIEPHSVVGGIFQDITEPTFQKEQIIGRAQQVIEKNLKTVQQIAYLLGENAADSEVILNSIVSSFGAEEVDDNDAEATP